MRKNLIALLLGLVLLVAPAMITGCATICSNGPGVATNLQATVNTLEAQVKQLEGVLINGYDAEIALAVTAAKAALVGAQALLKQWCPDPTAVDAVVKNASEVVTPSTNAAVKRAYKIGLVKP